LRLCLWIVHLRIASVISACVISMKSGIAVSTYRHQNQHNCRHREEDISRRICRRVSRLRGAFVEMNSLYCNHAEQHWHGEREVGNKA
jgi:hypothetical protein